MYKKLQAELNPLQMVLKRRTFIYDTKLQVPFLNFMQKTQFADLVKCDKGTFIDTAAHTGQLGDENTLGRGNVSPKIERANDRMKSGQEKLLEDDEYNEWDDDDIAAARSRSTRADLDAECSRTTLDLFSYLNI